MRTTLWRLMALWTGVLFALGAILSPAPGWTQTNAPSTKAEPVSNRYLIIVETSKNTIKRGDGILDFVNTVVMNGMKGQMNSGDTLGMWTYNNKLQAGEFPLQIWTPANKPTVARNTQVFLKRSKFENKPRLAEVMPSLKELIKDSDFITVLIVNSGRDKISGTPFDKEINTAYESWAPDQEKRKMPILTVLRATKGVITHHAVVPIPWTWEMPPLPPELVAAWETAKKQAETITNKPPPVVGQALIVKGKKPEPVKALPAVTPGPTVSNVPPKAATPAKPPVVVEATKPAEQSTPPPAVAPKPTATVEPANSAPVPPAKETPPPAVNPKPEPIKVAEPAKNQVSPAAVPPTTEPSLAKAAPTTPPASSLQLAQSNTEPTHAPTRPAPAAQPAPDEPVKEAPVETSPRTPQQGILVPGPTIWENEWLWVGIGLATLAVVIVGYSMMRRSRPASKISLITSSYDRTDKS